MIHKIVARPLQLILTLMCKKKVLLNLKHQSQLLQCNTNLYSQARGQPHLFSCHKKQITSLVLRNKPSCKLNS